MYMYTYMNVQRALCSQLRIYPTCMYTCTCTMYNTHYNVYMYMCIKYWIYVLTTMNIHVCTYMYTYMYTCMYTCIHTCMWLWFPKAVYTAHCIQDMLTAQTGFMHSCSLPQ